MVNYLQIRRGSYVILAIGLEYTCLHGSCVSCVSVYNPPQWYGMVIPFFITIQSVEIFGAVPNTSSLSITCQWYSIQWCLCLRTWWCFFFKCSPRKLGYIHFQFHDYSSKWLNHPQSVSKWRCRSEKLGVPSVSTAWGPGYWLHRRLCTSRMRQWGLSTGMLTTHHEWAKSRPGTSSASKNLNFLELLFQPFFGGIVF